MSPDQRVPRGNPVEEPTPPSRVPQLSLRLLCQSGYCIPRCGPVRCRLWRVGAKPSRGRPAYAVSMDGLGYRRFCILGRDEARARAVFDLLVRNTVTPCALLDVLEAITSRISTIDA